LEIRTRSSDWAPPTPSSPGEILTNSVKCSPTLFLGDEY
jgi:hypothetical protein